MRRCRMKRTLGESSRSVTETVNKTAETPELDGLGGARIVDDQERDAEGPQ